MIKVNQLHWFETQTHGGRKLYAKSHGLDWRIDPVNPTRRGDAERVEREKAKAQGEFEAHIMSVLIHDDAHEYIIGTQTFERVFRPIGATNLSDLQAVLDRVELVLASEFG